MSVVERAVVGRKTPGDGRVEVSAQVVAALGGDGTSVQVRVHGREETGAVEIMACTCEKAGASGKHEHHFVQCDAFRQLPVGSPLQLTAHRAILDVALAP